MKRIGSIAALAIVAILFVSVADARPPYPKALAAKYPAAQTALKAAKCGACHGKSKKMLSAFGMELKGALGAKNVKDAAKITAAIEKAAAKKNADDATYDSLLKAGKLPAPYKAE